MARDEVFICTSWIERRYRDQIEFGIGLMYLVYFTEISINDGHINLWFTGLILSIYDTNKHYQFTVSSIKVPVFKYWTKNLLK
jgi:hypothetical protein